MGPDVGGGEEEEAGEAAEGGHSGLWEAAGLETQPQGPTCCVTWASK